MLSFKLEVIRWICDDQALRVRSFRSRAEATAQAQRQSEERWAKVLELCAGQEVALCDVAHNLGLSVRTIGRDLEARDYYPEDGWCRMPTLSQEAERRAQALRGEPVAPPPDEYSEEDFHLEDENEGLVDDEDEEGEAVEAGGPQVKLEPPAELAPIVQGILNVADEEQRRRKLPRYLLDTAFGEMTDEHRQDRARVFRGIVWEGMAKSQETSDLSRQVQAGLCDPDQVVRGRLALRLAWHGELVEHMGIRYYQDILSRPDLPPALREPLESIVVWLNWWEERALARIQQREQEEAAARDHALWNGVALE